MSNSFPSFFPPPIASFGNIQIFGDPNVFFSYQFSRNTADAVDSFLGLTPGTTIYGVDPCGRLWGVSGSFSSLTQAGVQSAQAILLSWAGPYRDFGRPTGEKWPSNFRYERNCRFIASEVVFGPITQAGTAGPWTGTFKLVMRQIGPAVG